MNPLKVVTNLFFYGMIFVVVMLIWDAFVLSFIPRGVLASEHFKEVDEEHHKLFVSGEMVLFVIIWFHALIEEIIFRWVPLFFFAEWDSSEQYGRRIVITVRTFLAVFISSFLFGWAHGNLWHVLIQGVFGLVLCGVFIFVLPFLPTRWNSYTRSMAAVLITTFLHAFFNFILVNAENL